MRVIEGYYDIPLQIEELLRDTGALDDFFHLQDLKQRKIYINGEIEPFVVEEVVRHILQFNREDVGVPYEERSPILLYLVSVGGDVDSGFELIDVISNSKTPVYTVNLGYQYSMGFLIGLAGQKRYAMPNAKFLMHDGDNFIHTSGAKAQDQMRFQGKVEERIRAYVLEHTKISEQEFDNNIRVEWYMFADEAKKYGVTDYIIGLDCTIEEIV